MFSTEFKKLMNLKELLVYVWNCTVYKDVVFLLYQQLKGVGQSCKGAEFVYQFSQVDINSN